jgi:hypothetical protein
MSDCLHRPYRHGGAFQRAAPRLICAPRGFGRASPLVCEGLAGLPAGFAAPVLIANTVPRIDFCSQESVLK